MIRVMVDYCRGPAGAFLAIGNLVVAGDATGGGRTIMSFEVDVEMILRAVATAVKPIGDAAVGETAP